MKKGTIVFSLVCTLIMILKSECDKCEIFWVNQNPNIFAYQKLHGGKMVWMNVQIHIYQNSYLNAHLNILITNLIFKWIFWIMIYSNEYSFDCSAFLDICLWKIKITSWVPILRQSAPPPPDTCTRRGSKIILNLETASFKRTNLRLISF